MSAANNKKTLLVVDDTPVNIEILVGLLGDRYRIKAAKDGKNALRITSSEDPPDLILLDIVMSEMDGYEVCRRLKEDRSTRDIPVIFLSSLTDPMDKVKAFTSGGVDYVAKPFQGEEVLARVETHLKLKDSLAQLERRGAELRKTFGRFVSDEVADDLLGHAGGAGEEAREEVITIMIAGLKGFAALTERRAAGEVLALVNSFLHVMTDVVLQRRGTIIEFRGSGILAIFGAPVPHEDAAAEAVACAIEMQDAMQTVNSTNQDRELPALAMGIGLNTGRAVVGALGSQRRAQYGVLGRNVGIAAGIESVAVGGQILVSEGTVDAIGSRLNVSQTREMQVPGSEQPIAVHEVVGVGGEYNVFLPAAPLAPRAKLKTEIPVRFSMLSAKGARDIWHPALVTAVSRDEAEARCLVVPAELSDLRLEISPGKGQPGFGHIHAKVTSATDGGFLARFTAVPPEAAAFLAGVLHASGTTD